MKEQRFDIFEIYHDEVGLPAVLFGEHSENIIVFFHGENGSKGDARRFAEVACPLGYQVLGVDLLGHGENQIPFPSKTEDKWYGVYLTSIYAMGRWSTCYIRADDFGAYLTLNDFCSENVKGIMFVNPTMPADAKEPDLPRYWNCPMAVFQSAKDYEAPDFIKMFPVRYTILDKDESEEKSHAMLEYWERHQLKDWKEDREAKMISDEESILLCAIRYACGRMTYMPSVVIGYITPKIKELSSQVLHIIDSDLVSSRMYSGGMGDDNIDKPGWIRFHDAVRNELASREEPTVDLSRGW